MSIYVFEVNTILKWNTKHHTWQNRVTPLNMMQSMAKRRDIQNGISCQEPETEIPTL